MNDQQMYFDESPHRHPVENALHPMLYQQLEMEHLENSLAVRPGARLLDFGAGSGRVSFWFLKKGYNVTAVDVSKQSLKDVSNSYNKHKTSTWGELKTFTRIPNAVFDAIVRADVLHHVDILHYLPLFYKALKPGSRIAFSEPNAWHLPWYIHWASVHIPWDIEKGVLQCTPTNLKRSLKRSGFRHVTVEGHGLVPTKLLNPLPSLCRYNALTLGNAPLLSLLAFRYIIVAQQ